MLEAGSELPAWSGWYTMKGSKPVWQVCHQGLKACPPGLTQTVPKCEFRVNIN